MSAPTRFDEFKTALETRNFEIGLFWQRSNYFLGLNTAIGVGFFAVGDRNKGFGLLLGGLGLVAAVLWVLVNLGSRYWQLRWEQQVEDAELALAPAFQGFFNATREELDEAVRRSLPEHKRRRVDRRFWNWSVLQRPSVSLMMTYLSCAFVLFWVGAGVALAVC